MTSFTHSVLLLSIYFFRLTSKIIFTGPYGLIDCTKPDGTPLVAGLEVTAFTDAEEKAAGAWDWVMGNAKSMEQVFTEQGATFVGGPDWAPHVKVSGNLITAQNPGSAPACAAAVIAALA